MKRRVFKFLLSLIRALVLLKRFFVWLLSMIGAFLLWLLRPAFPFIVVPAYRLLRSLQRKYRDISENPWERRRAVFGSRPVLFGALILFVLFTSRLAIAAYTSADILPGSRSLILTKIATGSENIDWQVDEELSSSATTDLISEERPMVIYRQSGVAYVYPFSEQSTELPSLGEKPTETSIATAPYQKYSVQRGDVISKIAKKFNIKIETLLWANHITEKTLLRAGDTLLVPRVDGVLYSTAAGDSLAALAKRYGIGTQTIASVNNISVNSALKKGQVILLPGARQITVVAAKPKSTPVPEPEPAPAPAPEPVPEVVSPTPMPTITFSEEEPEPELLPPTGEVTEITVIKRPPLQAGEKMLWPTTQRSITQYFSSRHAGLDINGDYSDKLFAADDGVVIKSGWNNTGYGNMIAIDHGNGFQTRYGHCSKVYVRAGQVVSKGDVIAMVGTTGRSTGTHLHFEVILNGKRVNPLKYIR